MKLSELIDRAYKNAKEKGWHEKDRPALEVHALFTSEVAEATEEVRSRHKELPDLYFRIEDAKYTGLAIMPGGKLEVEGTCVRKPEGEPAELADVIIRFCDFLGSEIEKYKIDDLPKFIEEVAENPRRTKLFEELVEKNFLNPLCIHQMVNNLIAQSSVDCELHEYLYSKNIMTHVASNLENRYLHLVEAWMVIEEYFLKRGWNIEEVIELKMKYNETRPHRHGGKKF
jgi:hypothetical protein